METGGSQVCLNVIEDVKPDAALDEGGGQCGGRGREQVTHGIIRGGLSVAARRTLSSGGDRNDQRSRNESDEGGGEEHVELGNEANVCDLRCLP